MNGVAGSVTVGNDNEAKIGDVYYETLAAAFTAAEAGDEIILLKDVTLASPIGVDKKVILNLGEFTITNSYTYATESKNDYLIGVKYGGDLTIKADTDGEIIAAADKGISTVIKLTLPGDARGESEKATLTIKGGTFSGADYAVSGNGNDDRQGTVLTINGGKFEGKETAIYQPQGESELTITGGEFIGYRSAVEIRSGIAMITGSPSFSFTYKESFKCLSNGGGTTTYGSAFAIAQHTTKHDIDVTVTGGTFNHGQNQYGISVFNPQNNSTSSIVLAVSYNINIAIADDSAISGNAYAAKIVRSDNKGTINTYYATLADAVTGAVNGDKIVLLKNIELTQRVDFDKVVTLDLNGKTISAISQFAAGHAGGVIGVHRGADLTIIDETGKGSIKANDNVVSAITVTVNGESETGKAAKLTVNGGEFIGRYYAIVGNGDRHNTEIAIKGGSFSGTEANDNLAIYHPQEGTLTITGGTFTGYNSAIEFRAGTLNISGGTFESTAETFSCIHNGNGTTTVGAALAIAQHTTKKNINVTVTGGTFTCKEDCYGISVFNPENNPDTLRKVSLTVSNKIDTTIAHDDSPKIVAEKCTMCKPFVAKINKDKSSTYCSTLAEAFTGFSASDEKIVLIDDVEIKNVNDNNYYVTISDKIVTFELNGYIIIADHGNVFEVKKVTSETKLTIMDSRVTDSSKFCVTNGLIKDLHNPVFVAAKDGATVNITGGHFSSGDYGQIVYATNGATVNIKGGVFENNQEKGIGEKYGYILNQQDIDEQLINVSAGEFIKYHPGMGDSATEVSFLADGYGEAEIEEETKWVVGKTANEADIEEGEVSSDSSTLIISMEATTGANGLMVHLNTDEVSLQIPAYLKITNNAVFSAVKMTVGEFESAYEIKIEIDGKPLEDDDVEITLPSDTEPKSVVYVTEKGISEVYTEIIFLQNEVTFKTTHNSAYKVLNDPVVKFDAKGGTCSVMFDVTHDGKLSDLPVPTKSGYRFDGWYKGDVKVKPNETEFTESLETVTAHWSKNPVPPTPTTEHTVTYDVDGGSVKAPTQEPLKKGETFTAASYSGTKDGYTFGGWSYNGKTYQPGSKITMGNTDIVLKAVWMPISETHSVTYDVNGGSGEAPTQEPLKKGETFTVASYSGTKDGYTFGGWSYNGTTYKSGDTVTMGDSDIVLKAVWTSNPAPSDDSNTGLIIGIVVGAIAVIALIGGVVYFTKKR